MCETQPGPRCSSHTYKKMQKSEENVVKAEKELDKLNRTIQVCKDSYDMKKAQELLNRKRAKVEKLIELEEAHLDAVAEYNTSPAGLAELKEKMDKTSNPKEKSNLASLYRESADERDRQRCSRKLYVRNQEADPELMRKRVETMERMKANYLAAWERREDETGMRMAKNQYAISRDRVLLAEAGNARAQALSPCSLRDALNRKQGVQGCYVRVGKDHLVEDYSEYFPHGNPIDEVTSVEKDGSGYLLVTKSGQKVRSGEILDAIYPEQIQRKKQALNRSASLAHV